MQQAISKIVTLSDIKKSLSTYREYLNKHGIDYNEMEKDKVKEIKSKKLSKEDEERNLANVSGIYLKAEKSVVKQMIMTYFANELKESQIKLEEIFNWVDSVIEEIEKEFKLGFDKEDKLELGFEVLKTLFAVLSDYTTLAFNEKEVKLLREQQEKREKESKKILKENRSFHRGTPQLDKKEGD